METDRIIVCGGALGSPRLVKKVLATVDHPSERVGTGFMDHPIGFVGKVKVKKEFNKMIRKFALLDKGTYECRTAIRIKSKCGKYTCAAFFRPALTMENKLEIYKYKSQLGASRGADKIKNLFSTKLIHPDILAEIYSHLFHRSISGRVYNILLVFEQKRGSNTVSYEENGIVLDWRITEEEISIYRDILKKLQIVLAEIAEEQNINTDIDESWLWSHAHHSGTISMGKNPEALVDPNLKLKNCDNVFVCDGSIIQEHSYANTGLTIGQLALGLAERISR